MVKNVIRGDFRPLDGGSRCGYGIFNRRGGLSVPPYDSLNVSYTVGDTADVVDANRRLLKQEMALPRLLSARQNHGDGVYVLACDPAEDLEVADCDILMTDRVGTGLLIQHADCQAVLLFDRRRVVIAAVHCGWRGSVIGILATAVQRLSQEYGSEPVDLQAVISPSLGHCCGQFVNHQRELPQEFGPFRVGDNHFDFWRISHHQLTCCGLLPKNILLPAVCTSCSEDFFSYRRACRGGSPITGRNGSIIALY